jgi:hypothetical protein
VLFLEYTKKEEKKVFFMTSPTFGIFGFIFPLIFFFIVLRIIRSFFKSSHRNIESRMESLRFPEHDYDTINRYPPVEPPAKEGEIFRLADEMRGRLTLSDIVIATNLSLKQAEEVIDSMVDGIHVTMEVKDSGRVVYEFPEIIAKYDKSDPDT